MLIDKDARGNKLSSCKIPKFNILKNKNFLNTGNLGLKKKRKENNSKYKSVLQH